MEGAADECPGNERKNESMWRASVGYHLPLGNRAGDQWNAVLEPARAVWSWLLSMEDWKEGLVPAAGTGGRPSEHAGLSFENNETTYADLEWRRPRHMSMHAKDMPTQSSTAEATVIQIYICICMCDAVNGRADKPLRIPVLEVGDVLADKRGLQNVHLEGRLYCLVNCSNSLSNE